MASTARAISSGLVPWRSGTEARLPGELLLGLPRAGQRRAGTDAVDPDAWGQRQRHRLGQRPQPGLGDGVGDEVRRDRPDPLVQHVDHHALGVGRQRAGEVLHQHEGRAQAGLDMRVPGGAGGVMPFVALERAGVVDQHADRAERSGGFAARAPGWRFRCRGRRCSSAGAAANAADRRAGRHGGVAVGMAMQGDIKAGIRERERDGAADALCRAGDQCGAGNACGNVQRRNHLSATLVRRVALFKHALPMAASAASSPGANHVPCAAVSGSRASVGRRVRGAALANAAAYTAAGARGTHRSRQGQRHQPVPRHHRARLAVVLLHGGLANTDYWGNQVQPWRRIIR